MLAQAPCSRRCATRRESGPAGRSSTVTAPGRPRTLAAVAAAEAGVSVGAWRAVGSYAHAAHSTSVSSSMAKFREMAGLRASRVRSQGEASVQVLRSALGSIGESNQLRGSDPDPGRPWRRFSPTHRAVDRPRSQLPFHGRLTVKLPRRNRDGEIARPTKLEVSSTPTGGMAPPVGGPGLVMFLPAPQLKSTGRFRIASRACGAEGRAISRCPELRLEYRAD
jgi:hypothetical protein